MATQINITSTDDDKPEPNDFPPEPRSGWSGVVGRGRTPHLVGATPPARQCSVRAT